MNVLIADKVNAKMIDALTALGVEVTYKPELAAEDLATEIGDVKVLIVRSKKVTGKVIDAGKHLSLIIRAGAGVNTIDLDAASRNGIYVANCPGKNTDAVAELVIGLLIACDRGIADATQALRQGAWQKKKFGNASGLKTRTMGIIGLGAIGMAVAQRAQALGMPILAWSRRLTPEQAEGYGFEFAATPLEVAQKADAISIHVAAAPETKGMIHADFFAAMKKGAIFLNTARGDVVDYAALLEAIDTRELKVGLDVFPNEPTGGEAAFEQVELAAKVVCTPHIGASTEQAEEAIAAEVVRIVEVFISDGSPPNAVNIRAPQATGSKLVVRHHNRVGVLAQVLAQLRDKGINIEEMQNRIFDQARTASCTITLDKTPTPELLDVLRQDPSIIEVMI